MRRLILAAASLIGLAAGIAALPANAAEETPAPPKRSWSFDGMFGTYDRAALQRGFQVYKEVCAACHAMKYVYYRNLTEIGLSAEQVKAVAASVEVNGGLNDQGEAFTRPGTPADRLKAPYPNEKASRAANGGALPPDQSLLVNAREGGADYINAILTGYQGAPSGFALGDGMNYNKYFPGHQIRMAQPLQDEQVTYADGTKATVEQMASDVTTFLAWASNPELEQRKRMGIRIVLFLILMTGVTYAVKRKVWASVH